MHGLRCVSWLFRRLADLEGIDLSAFRSALVDLTYQIDELENLKYGHYRTALDLSQETSLKILDYSALVVRAEIEVFEKIAQKGWDSSGGLEELMTRAADPFNTGYGNNPGDNGEIFSILPTESILPSPHGALSRAGSISGTSGNTATEGKYQSLSAALSQNGDFEDYDDEDANSIFSGGFTANHPGPSHSKSGGGGGGGGIGGGGKLGLPGFSPTSSAGWGNIDQTSSNNSVAAPPSTVDERTEPRDGDAWQESSESEDGENRTLRNHSTD